MIIKYNKYKPLIIKRSFYVDVNPLYQQFATEVFDKEHIPLCVVTFKEGKTLIMREGRDISALLYDMTVVRDIENNALLYPAAFSTLNYVLYKNYKNFFMKLKELPKESIDAEIAWIKKNSNVKALAFELHIMKQYFSILLSIFAINHFPPKKVDVIVYRNAICMGGKLDNTIKYLDEVEEILLFENGELLNTLKSDELNG